MGNFRRRALGLVGLASAVGLSVFTPIFSGVVGEVLFFVGERYNAQLQNPNAPSAYVVLGGGLTQKQQRIVANAYTKTRVQRAWAAWQKKPLPVLASGVEAPWIAALLNDFSKNHTSRPVVFQENASMNTCENARFSAKLMQHLSDEDAWAANRSVYLVSDWYHMARARRQFALVGIATYPIPAPLPTKTAWLDPKANLDHSRRAAYEMAALLRDIFRPQQNCRSAQSVSLEQINTPSQSFKVF